MFWFFLIYRKIGTIKGFSFGHSYQDKQNVVVFRIRASTNLPFSRLTNHLMSLAIGRLCIQLQLTILAEGRLKTAEEFGNIVLSGIQMLADCGFTQRNITIAALSLSIGLGFTQVSDIFCKMPVVIQNIFAQNCVAIVFVIAIVLNLILPKDQNK